MLFLFPSRSRAQQRLATDCASPAAGVERCHFSAVLPPINLQATFRVFKKNRATENGDVSVLRALRLHARPAIVRRGRAAVGSDAIRQMEHETNQPDDNETRDAHSNRHARTIWLSKAPQRICILMGNDSIKPYEP